MLSGVKAKQHYFWDVSLPSVLQPTDHDPGKQASGTKGECSSESRGPARQSGWPRSSSERALERALDSRRVGQGSLPGAEYSWEEAGSLRLRRAARPPAPPRRSLDHGWPLLPGGRARSAAAALVHRSTACVSPARCAPSMLAEARPCKRR